jgi:hypothetical protein
MSFNDADVAKVYGEVRLANELSHKSLIRAQMAREETEKQFEDLYLRFKVAVVVMFVWKIGSFFIIRRFANAFRKGLDT